jgi:phospholipase C
MTTPSTQVDSAGAKRGLGRDRVEHVIVLMMENRSFDHLLGYLKHDDASYPNLDGLDVRCPVDPRDPNSERLPTTSDATSVLGTDPDHRHESVMLQIYGAAGDPAGGQPNMNGFIRSYALKIGGSSLRPTSALRRFASAVMQRLAVVWRSITRRPAQVTAHAKDIMKCFSEADAPVLAQLAKEFAVFTNWHASVPGETWPNRNFAHAATSDGTVNIDTRFYDNKTIFEQLAEAKCRWAVYQDGVAQVWAFWRLWAGSTDNFHGADELFDDIKNDRLAAYSFVEPNHGYGKGDGNSQHPSNNTSVGDSFLAGEALIARIYNALVDQSDVFAKTLFLVTYDEHGGFFDHVPPHPVPPPDDEASASGFDFRISGVRVPAVAISPLIPKGTIDDCFYDHASIPKTVRTQFAPDLASLTARDDTANDVLDGLPLLPSARTDCSRIEPSPRAQAAEPATVQVLTGFEASLLELAGAVKTHLEQRGLAGTATTPPFLPDPALAAAAAARVMPPESPASRAVDDVVALFESPTDPSAT